ncbi:hypothetical protein CRG98_014079 [Punica granatum]|uniref:Retrotransposon gag domain-containing protein n=1 Tax=Punica granatum TaxID=22663 RepID=A0A2I0KAL1_PUNGR|nr:hypothetical protein CRG98_014079 [Punica granatum]
MRAELRAIREERDRLRCELVDSRAEMAEGDRVDISEEVNPPAPAYSQPPPMHAPPPPTPAGILPAYLGAPPTHLPPPTSSGAPLPLVSLTSSASDDQARITALEGTVNQMATNMAELLALLRGPNCTSSSTTPPPGQGPIVDPTPWVLPTQAPENMDGPAPPTLHTSMGHPFTSPYLPPPAPTAVPLPPATFLSSEQALSAPPPISIPVPAAAYTAPPQMVFPASSAPALTHPQAAELPPYPSLQPHVGLSYQAPPPINSTFHEPGTPTHAAQFASPTHFFPEADVEQEHRLKRIEETIRALQYWEYEEFVIHSFQDSLSGSALNWFMSLRAKDISTWADLSRKFIDQYRYCAEAPSTLLELSTKEMARGQRFEEYATKWRAQETKHIPPISETQQIQLFHSTLRGCIIHTCWPTLPRSPTSSKPGKSLTWGSSSAGWKAPPVKEKIRRRRSPQRRRLPAEGEGKKSPLTPSIRHIRPPTLVDLLLGPAGPVANDLTTLLAGDQIRPISPGPNFDLFVQDQSKRCEYHQGAPGHTLDNCWRLRDEIQRRINSNRLTFNAVRPPNVQDNPLPNHRPSSGPSINMISICASGRDEDTQDNPLLFVIDYTPEEPTVGFMGNVASLAPFVVDIPAWEPYSDGEVPWTYEGSMGSVEQ